jgi:hypothetical protein
MFDNKLLIFLSINQSFFFEEPDTLFIKGAASELFIYLLPF